MGHHAAMTFWIDTHAHLDAPELAHDIDAVRQHAAQAGVAHCVLPAVERSNWDTARLLAHRHGDSYALGIHPLYTGRAQDEGHGAGVMGAEAVASLEEEIIDAVQPQPRRTQGIAEGLAVEMAEQRLHQLLNLRQQKKCHQHQLTK